MTIQNLPETYKSLQVHKLSTDFAAATRIVSMNMSELLDKMQPGDALLKNEYMGVNASDINFSAGRYDPSRPPPFVPGFEGVARVMHVKDAENTAKNPRQLKEGSIVAYMAQGGQGAFTEYLTQPSSSLIPIPNSDPRFIGALVSGMTAALALSEAAHLKSGETVLITAAAGGAGQMCVQWAKLKGAKHIIGTCSTEDKKQMLLDLGCTRVILYKQERVLDVVKKEYTHGVDVVFESVGGDMLNQCMESLAVRGRLLVIGAITTYKDEANDDGSKKTELAWADSVPTYKLLQGSKSVCGFFLPQYAPEMKNYLPEMIKSIATGEIQVHCDTEGFEHGLESVNAAVSHLHSGKNQGKVIVSMSKL